MADLPSLTRVLAQLKKSLHDAGGPFDVISSITSEAIIMIDENHHLFFFNKGAEQMFGYTDPEVTGQPLDILLPPRFVKGHSENISKFKEGAATSRLMGIQNSEIYGMRKNGEEFPMEISISKWNQHGHTIFTAICRDISDRRRIEKKYQLEYAFRKAIEDSITAGLVATDTDGRIIYVNSFFCRLVGWTEKELMGLSPPYVYWAPESADDAMLDFMKRLMEGDQKESELRLHKKTGEYVHTLVLRSPLLDETGKRVGLIAAFYDLTERKRVDESLRQSEERLLQATRTSDIGIFDHNHRTNTVYWSPEQRRNYGWGMEEPATLEGFLAVLYPEDLERIKMAVSRAHDPSGDGLFDVEHRIIHRNGEVRWLSTKSQTFFEGIGDNRRPVRTVGAVVDITERKKSEETQMRAEKLESLGILAGGIAHDFNNILAGIMGNISLAKTFLNPGGDVDLHLNEAEGSALRAKALANQLLTFAKGGAPVKKVTSLKNLLSEMVSFALRGSNIQNEVSLQDGLWPVEIDEGQIGQVIQNLVINALQAMPKGGLVRLKAGNRTIGEDEVKDFPLRRGDYVEILVQDDGIGIAEEHQKKIFDPYFTTKPKGSGLGLSISHSIIQRHQGFITVQSEPGRGTTFRFYIPAVPNAVASPVKTQEDLIKGQGRILLVDDEETILRTTGRMLQHLGYDVVTAATGTDGVTKFKTALKSGRRFDLVITDLTIPGDFGGITVLERLKEIDPEIKVVVSSGYSDDLVISEYKKYGFTDAIAKPYRTFELGITLSRAMRDDKQVKLTKGEGML